MAAAQRPELYVDDPMYSRKNAAIYLGISPKTLDRLTLTRHPMPGTSATPMMGYRRSTLNAYLESLASPRGRQHVRRKIG